MKKIQKIMKLTKILLGKGSQTPKKRYNATLIHPMSCKPQFSIDDVVHCLADKYKTTYQNIWGEGVVRPHLV